MIAVLMWLVLKEWVNSFLAGYTCGYHHQADPMTSFIKINFFKIPPQHQDDMQLCIRLAIHPHTMYYAQLHTIYDLLIAPVFKIYVCQPQRIISNRNYLHSNYRSHPITGLLKKLVCRMITLIPVHSHRRLLHIDVPLSRKFWRGN